MQDGDVSCQWASAKVGLLAWHTQRVVLHVNVVPSSITNLDVATKVAEFCIFSTVRFERLVQMDGLEAIDDVDCLVLVALATGPQVLLHTETWEACELDAARGPWTLQFIDTGRAVIADSRGEGIDALGLLEKHTRKRADGKVFVCQDYVPPVLLSELAHRHTIHYERYEVPILPDMRAVVPFHAKRLHFELTMKGARIMWELVRLHRFVLPDSLFYQSAQWPHNRFNWILQQLAEFAVPACHISKPRRTAQSRPSQNHGVSVDFTLSTYAVLVLLTVWSGRARNGDIKSRAISLLARLCTHYLGDEVVELAFAFEPAAAQFIGLPVAGSSPIQITIEHGAVHVGPLWQDARVHPAVRRELRDNSPKGTMPVWGLLRLWSLRAGKPSQAEQCKHWLRQLTSGVGTIMDDMILETPGSTDPTSDQYVRRAYDRHDENRREMEVLGQPGGSDAEAEHSSCGKKHQLEHWRAAPRCSPSTCWDVVERCMTQCICDVLWMRRASESARPCVAS